MSLCKLSPKVIKICNFKYPNSMIPGTGLVCPGTIHFGTYSSPRSILHIQMTIHENRIIQSSMWDYVNTARDVHDSFVYVSQESHMSQNSLASRQVQTVPVNISALIWAVSLLSLKYFDFSLHLYYMTIQNFIHSFNSCYQY